MPDIRRFQKFKIAISTQPFKLSRWNFGRWRILSSWKLEY